MQSNHTNTNTNTYSKRYVPISFGLLMTIIAVVSWSWLSGVQEAKAQPATFSVDTGILEIPIIEINSVRQLEEVELQLTDTNTLDFKLVDYAANRGDSGIQELILAYGEKVDLDSSRTIQFIDVLAESRCPLDVICITSGEVTVILRIIETLNAGNTARTDFGLTLSGLDLSRHYDNGSWYRLAAVNPYPVSTEEHVDEDYVITLEISALPFK